MSGNFLLVCNDDINAQMSDRGFGWKMEIHSALMYSHRAERHRVDCVDLDPYGTAAPFIDAAVQCVNDGGHYLSALPWISTHFKAQQDCCA